MKLLLPGEWWLIDGQAVFADGDVGELNHDGHVWQHLLSEFADELDAIPELAWLRGQVRDWVNTDGGDPAYLRTIINDLSDGAFKAGEITQEQYDAPNAWIQALLDWSDIKWSILTADDTTVRAREWAIETLGWVRVHGNACELWQLSQRALKDLADGLWDAHQEEAADALYFLEVHHPRRQCFEDVPFTVLEAGELVPLYSYKRRL